MISSSHRFHGYNSLRHVYRQGKTVRGPLFSTRFLINPKRTRYRISVVVSRKVNKSAVARNRIRRRLYEAVRLMESDILQPYDIVVTVFSDSVLQESPTDLRRQVEKQLKEAGILATRVTRQS